VTERHYTTGFLCTSHCIKDTNSYSTLHYLWKIRAPDQKKYVLRKFENVYWSGQNATV